MTDNAELENAYNLGSAYMTGTGRPLDYREGIKYLRIAADGGYVPAIRDLGVAYLNGLGVPPSAEKAYPLLKKASGEMDPNAMYHLALMYENGAGVEKDLYEALRLMAYAAGLGMANAATEANRIEGEVDAERKRRLFSRPLLKLEISDVDVEACCCKPMMDSVLAKDIFVEDTYEGPMLVMYDRDKDQDVPITACPYCKKKAVRVKRGKKY